MLRNRSAGPGPLPVLPAAILALPVLFSCADGSGTPLEYEGPNEGFTCDLETRFIADGGVGRRGIPQLTNPPLVLPNQEQALSYLDDEDRVAGIILDGRPVAIPLPILWWHEIVNLDGAEAKMAVTLCPLTGSTLAFDRETVGGDTLVVSGLLFQSNLIIVNEGPGESLWPQMLAEARCGPATGTPLARFPMVEMTWGGWKRIHSGTRVVTGDLPFPNRDYALYPYHQYKETDNPEYRFPVPPLDMRRPPKERTLGLPSSESDPGIGFPFGALDAAGDDWTVVETTYEGDDVVVFWDSRARGAMAFRPVVDGRRLHFRATGKGIVDEETGTRWAVDGRGISGPLRTEALSPILDAYVAFWASWQHFHPDTRLWEG